MFHHSITVFVISNNNKNPNVKYIIPEEGREVDNPAVPWFLRFRRPTLITFYLIFVFMFMLHIYQLIFKCQISGTYFWAI